MYMPLNIDIRKALIFAGERGEGLQKTHKLARYADEILVIPETPTSGEILVKAGLSQELNEKLFLTQDRWIPVHPLSAAQADLETLLLPGPGVFVVSDLKDRKLNERISQLCSQRGILCNIIDTKDLCSVWFMSLIDTSNLSIALSSKGGAAFYSARLREELQPWIERKNHQAMILSEIREKTPADQRFSTLERIWKDRWFQLWSFLGFHKIALKRAQSLGKIFKVMS